MKKRNLSVLIASCIVGTSAIFIQSESVHACLVEPCPAWPIRVNVNFGNTLVYEQNAGVCTVLDRNNRVIQKSASCRKTWHQITYTANKLLFYDRQAGEIEVYNINKQGISNRLQRFTHAQNRVRKTWAQINSPREGVITFKDDNGQVENYSLQDSGIIARIK